MAGSVGPAAGLFDAHDRLHGIGNETGVMRLVMERGERRCLWSGARELQFGPENDTRHPLAAVRRFLHVPLCGVAIGIDDQARLRSEEEKPEHVAA